ncbi:MAG: glycosyltransferase family 39 protein [Tepidisphaeraceae bacterium]
MMLPFANRRWLILLVLLLGVAWSLSLPPNPMPSWGPAVGCGLGLCAALFAPLHRALKSAVTPIRLKLEAHRLMSALAVGMAVCAYLLLQVWLGRGEMFLRLHDEHSYMIQARMLAQGRLWMPAYPPGVSPFFDTFYVIVDRVYAPMYFPGTALAAAPALWLRLPYWTSPLICGAAAAAVFYAIALELFGPIRALIAVLLLVSRPYFRAMSVMLMSETPSLLAMMILIWAWLRWRRQRRLAWALLIGASAAWGAITRPLDALCFAVPIALAMLFELRTQPKAILKMSAAVALSALPFAALQIAQNVGVTGKWWQCAEQYYTAENFPAPVMGFGPFDLTRFPTGWSNAKKAFALEQLDRYRHHTLSEELKAWYPARFVDLIYVTLPATMLVALLPLALLAANDPRRIVLLAVIPLFLAGYLAFLLPLLYHMVPIIPLMICALLMGWEALERAWPSYRQRIAAFTTVALTATALGALPEFNRNASSILLACEPLKQITRDLSVLTKPSVVLFPFDESRIPVNCFPVYNDDVAWPDEATVIRANDLGEDHNWKLFDYYARLQPQREFYLYDRSTPDDPRPLKFLAAAGDLAANHARR